MSLGKRPRTEHPTHDAPLDRTSVKALVSASHIMLDMYESFLRATRRSGGQVRALCSRECPDALKDVVTFSALNRFNFAEPWLCRKIHVFGD
jgi:hypothetical protein